MGARGVVEIVTTPTTRPVASKRVDPSASRVHSNSAGQRAADARGRVANVAGVVFPARTVDAFAGFGLYTRWDRGTSGS